MAEDESSDSSGWQLTESDPGVFTELLKTLGVDLVVDDLYSLSSEVLAEFNPIRALVFLFKWHSDQDASGGGTGEFDEEFPGFFAHQVVHNACATLAVLNAVMNIPEITVGPQLQDILSFTAGMDPQTRGFTITSSEFLRSAHNSLSPPNVFSMDGLNLPKEKEDSYHFIVYLPVAGSVYELDGLKISPVRHGAYSDEGEGWLAKAREIIEARIATYPPGAIEFNLMALHDNTLPSLIQQHQQAQSVGNEYAAAELAARITEENEKRSEWAFENSLRRHNHVGLIHALIYCLAKSELLDPAMEQAKTKMANRLEARRKKEEGKNTEKI